MRASRENRETLLKQAENNGHKPGHRFSTYICFCKKCNQLLTYIDSGEHGVNGLNGQFNQSCRG